MSDMARQPAQQPEQPEDDREQRPQERQPSVSTPSQFYEEFVAREDVRAILTRLADN